MNTSRVNLLILVLALVTLAVSGCGFDKNPTSSIEVASVGSYSAALDAKGQHWLIGSIYHGGSYWDQRGERLFNWNHKSGENSVIVATAISHDGRWAATAEKSAFVIWSTDTGVARAYIATPGEIIDIALSRNGDLLLVGLSNNSAMLYHTRSEKVVRIFQHRNRVRTVDLSQDGRFALTGSEDETAILWDINSGKSLITKQHDDEVQMVALSDNGELAMTSAQYDKAIIWRTDTGTLLGKLPLSGQHLARGTRFTAARFSSDNRFLLTGQPNRSVQLWQVSSLKLVEQWQLPKRSAWKPTSASVQAVAFGAGDQFYAISSNGFTHQLAR